MTVRFFESYILSTPFGRTYGVHNDIHISADFARTFASGEGLHWYPNAPKIEGFSSPLWVFIIAAIHLCPQFNEDALGLWIIAVNATDLAKEKLSQAKLSWIGRGSRISTDKRQRQNRVSAFTQWRARTLP
jgi:hypothetical protein